MYVFCVLFLLLDDDTSVVRSTIVCVVAYTISMDKALEEIFKERKRRCEDLLGYFFIFVARNFRD